MRRTINNLTLWAILGFALLLFVPAAIFVSRQDLFEIMDAVCIAVGAGVIVGYFRSFWDAIKMPPHLMTAAHLVITGTFLVSLAIIVVFTGQWVWRLNGKPDWIIDSVPVAFSRWLIGTGLILSLLTSYSKEGVVVVGAYKRTAALVTMAVLIAAVLIWAGFG